MKCGFIVNCLIFVVGVFSGCSSVNNSILDSTNQIKQGMGILDSEFKKEGIFLKLDVNAHTNIIKDIAVSSDKKTLVTGSEDSYVRVWDISSGKMLRKISGYIGLDGSTGNIYAIALSPDNKYLAVAGNFSKTGTAMKNMFTDDIKAAGAIRIHDFKTGELVTLIEGHNNIVNDLTFSKDGKVLLSASDDNTVNILDVTNNFNKINQITAHSSYVRAVDIKQTQQGYNILSVAKSGRIFLHSFNLQNNTLAMTKTLRDNIELTGAKFSKNLIAVTGLRKILVFNSDLKLIKIIKTTKPYNYRPNFTEDEKYLICAGSEVSMYDIKNDYKKISINVPHENTVLGLELLDNNTLVSSSFRINFYDYRKHEMLSQFHSQYNPIYSVGLKNNNLAFGHKKYDKKKSNFNDRGPLEKVFNLETRKVSPVVKISQYNLMSRRYGLQRISPVKNNTKLAMYDRGILMSEIPTALLSPGTKNRVFGYYDEDNYILTALDRNIYAFSNSMFDLFHSPESIFIGHSGAVYAMATDKKRLLTGATDGILKLWDLKDIGEKEIIHSRINLFVGSDNEWVMWTNEGYFDSSANGYKYIGFHVNQGVHKNANYIGIEKLYDYFFRPDLVKLALKGEDISQYTNNFSYKTVLQNPPPEVNIKTKNNLSTKSKTVTIDFEIIEVDAGGVGLIRIYQEGKLVQSIGDGKIQRESNDVINKHRENKLNMISRQKQEEYLSQLQRSTKSIDGNFDVFTIVADVEPILSTNIIGSYSVTLPLKSGSNNFSIEAFNKTNTVLSVRKNILINAKIKKRRPKIYVIAAGVNEFEQDNVSQLKYSENDARSIAKEIKNATEYKTEVTLLTGKKVTKENILKAIAKIKKKAHLEDKIVFYISTHGKAARGRLYLVPQNNKKLKNWINFEEIFTEIQSVAALDQIFIIDACESGQASDIMSSVYDAKASVLAKQSGVHLLMATTKGTFAFESADKNVQHGVFTHNILKALNAKSTDKNNNKKISIVELSKVLQESKYSVAHQFPIIRNVGEDTYIKKLKN